MDSGASLSSVAQWSLGVIGTSGGDRLGEWVSTVDAEDHITELIDGLTIDTSDVSHASDSKVFGASTSFASVSGEGAEISGAGEIATVENRARHGVNGGYLSSSPLGKRDIDTALLSAEENAMQMGENVAQLCRTATSGAEKFGCIGADRHPNHAGKELETGMTGARNEPEIDQHSMPTYNVSRKVTEAHPEEQSVEDRANMLHETGDEADSEGCASHGVSSMAEPFCSDFATQRSGIGGIVPACEDPIFTSIQSGGWERAEKWNWDDGKEFPAESLSDEKNAVPAAESAASVLPGYPGVSSFSTSAASSSSSLGSNAVSSSFQSSSSAAPLCAATSGDAKTESPYTSLSGSIGQPVMGINPALAAWYRHDGARGSLCHSWRDQSAGI